MGGRQARAGWLPRQGRAPPSWRGGRQARAGQWRGRRVGRGGSQPVELPLELLQTRLQGLTRPQLANPLRHELRGRLAVGLGAGGDAAEHQALGMEFGAAEERLTLMEETIGIFRAMLEGDPTQRVTRPSQGAAPSLLEAASAPRPAHQVPLYVAGDHERSIDLAARAGDGWIAPAASFAQGVTRFRGASERAGRTGLVAFALQELGKGESLKETPFGRDPRGWLAAQGEAGADSVVITVRDRSDIAQLSAMIR